MHFIGAFCAPLGLAFNRQGALTPQETYWLLRGLWDGERIDARTQAEPDQDGRVIARDRNERGHRKTMNGS